MGLFKRKKWQFTPDFSEMRWYMIVAITKDLSKTDYDKLKELLDLVYESQKKNKSIKTPEQIVDEAGGFLLHQKDGVVK